MTDTVVAAALCVLRCSIDNTSPKSNTLSSDTRTCLRGRQHSQHSDLRDNAAVSCVCGACAAMTHCCCRTTRRVCRTPPSGLGSKQLPHYSALTTQTPPLHYGSTAVASGSSPCCSPAFPFVALFGGEHSKRCVKCQMFRAAVYIGLQKDFFPLPQAAIFFCCCCLTYVSYVQTLCLHPYTHECLERTLLTSNDAEREKNDAKGDNIYSTGRKLISYVAAICCGVPAFYGVTHM